MRRFLSALAILAGLVLAQEPAEPQVPEEQVVEEEFENPFACEGRIFRGERDAPTVFVRLREGGLLQVKAGEDWKEATLGDLGTFLATSRDSYDLEQRKIGKSGLEDVPRGGKASRLFVSIEADPGVPWQHLQWIMTILAEEKLRKLEMVEGNRKLVIYLPVDRAVCGFDPDYKPPPVIKAEIHVVARGEQPAKWGDLDVLRPTEVRFKCGDFETADLAEATACLRKTKKAVEERKEKNVVFYGEIKAGHKAPYGKVFDVMEAFVAAGITDVDFYGTAIPPKAVRSAKLLPYPAKNYEAD